MIAAKVEHLTVAIRCSADHFIDLHGANRVYGHRNYLLACPLLRREMQLTIRLFVRAACAIIADLTE